MSITVTITECTKARLLYQWASDIVKTSPARVSVAGAVDVDTFQDRAYSHRMTRVLCRALWVLCLSGFVGSDSLNAAEFYSWIDPSGTMVMTDDPSHIPPSLTRSPVSIHRFEETVGHASEPRRHHRPLAASEEPRGARPATTGAVAGDAPMTDHAFPQAKAAEPVLIETPDEAARRDYLWVPLLAPVYFGNNQVSGFWCHRSVSSPVDAFMLFLAQQGGVNHQVLISGGQIQLGNVFNSAGRSGWSRARSSMTPTGGAGLGPAGTTVYDQVLREQRALIERATAPFQPSGGQPRRSTTGRSHGPGPPRGHVR